MNNERSFKLRMLILPNVKTDILLKNLLAQRWDVGQYLLQNILLDILFASLDAP